MIDNSIIEYWSNIIHAELPFADKEYVDKMMKALNEKCNLGYISINDTGVLAYTINKDFRNLLCLGEIIFYIRPECRGSWRLFMRYIKEYEKVGKENNCDIIRIGANIGYNDAAVIKAYKRLGYVDDTVSKRIK